MSTQNSREDDGSTETEPQPNCNTTLIGPDTNWKDRPAGVYPPGYPKLCPDCFDMVPDDAWNDDQTADYDHSQITDTLICSTMNRAARKMHLPDGYDQESDSDD